MKLSFSKIAIASAVIVATSVASADYLYAMIDGAKSVYDGTSISFDYATFSIPSQEGYLDISGGAGSGVTVYGTGVSSDETGRSTGGPFYVGDEDTKFNTFLIELWLGENDPTRVGWQQYSLAQVSGHIVTETGGSGDTPLTITSVIPEPTSGLLLLLGMAGLALRRRKA